MPTHNKKSPEEVAEWSKALDGGMGYQHVAEAFGVSKETVRKYLPGRGWTAKQIREHGTHMKHANAKIRKMEQRNKVSVPHDPMYDADLDMLQRRYAGKSPHQYEYS